MDQIGSLEARLCSPKTSELRWLKPREKFPSEDSKQGLAKTRPAMTIIVQQAYYNGGGPNTQKVK